MSILQNFANAITSLFSRDKTTAPVEQANNVSSAYALSRTYAPGAVRRDALPTRYTSPRELATVGYFTLNAPEQAPRNDSGDNVPPWLAGSPLAGLFGGANVIAPNYADIFAQFNTPAAPIFTVPVTPYDPGPAPAYNPVAPNFNPPVVEMPPITGINNGGAFYNGITPFTDVNNGGVGTLTTADF